MTTGEFGSIPLSSLIIPPERLRTEIPAPDIQSLKDSIQRLGLLNPITISRNNILIAGYRRTLAVRALDWPSIPFQYEDSPDPDFHFLQEFEENEKRIDFTWRERTLAISRYHSIMKLRFPDWTEGKTAAAMGVSRPSITQHLTVAKEISNPIVERAENFSKALGLSTRIAERRRADDGLIHTGNSITHTHIDNQSFLEWAPSYTGSKFNLIHCDFPYGINANNAKQGIAARLSAYDDSSSIYFDLLKCLATNLDNFCAPSAHLIFWFSMEYYSVTWELLKLLDDFTFDYHPLIWMKSDNIGLLPDPQRGPRRIYETAFFGRRGDRKIIRAKSNAYHGPTSFEIHPHEKPIPMLTHFMEMCVDGQTRLIDPTAGSGTALRAAKGLGAQTCYGLEQNPDYARRANEAYNNHPQPGLD